MCACVKSFSLRFCERRGYDRQYRMSESDAFILKKLKDRVPSIALHVVEYSGHESIVPLRICSKSGLEMLSDDAVRERFFFSRFAQTQIFSLQLTFNYKM